MAKLRFEIITGERVVLHPPKVSPVVRQIHPDAASIFRDSYLVEFLELPEGHAEAELHRGLLARLKEFLIELGRDFCFVGSEFPVQVGGRDFALDLLFFHRGLNCLVAIELKVGRFEPEKTSIDVKLGENTLAFFKATNLTKAPLSGVATFNVTPEIAGGYFNKVQCFCFDQQTLKAGETVEMPVSFFVDPALLKEPGGADINEITLSYTFYPSEAPAAPGGT